MAQVILLVGFSGQDEVRLFNRCCDRLARSFRPVGQTRPSDSSLFRGVGENCLLIDPAIVGRRGNMRRPEKVEEARVAHYRWIEVDLNNFGSLGETNPGMNDPWNTPVQGVDGPESAKAEGSRFQL